MSNRIIKPLLIAGELACLFCACKTAMKLKIKNSVAGEQQLNGKLVCIAGNGTCSEWIDTETGAHYFYTAFGGLELRVNADGTPYTEKNTEEE